MDAQSLVQIRESDIQAHIAGAWTLMQSVQAPSVAATPAMGRSGLPGLTARRPTVRGAMGSVAALPAASAANLVDTIIGVTPDDPLASPVQNQVLHAVRRGVAIARTIGDLYAAATPLERLLTENKTGRLLEAQQVEMRELLAASSLIQAFVTASFVRHALADALATAGAVPVTFERPSDIPLGGPQVALERTLGMFDAAVRAAAHDDTTLLAVTGEFWAALEEEVRVRRGGMSRLDVFEATGYRSEVDKFTVDGFAPATRGPRQVLTMQFKKPEEVIGNAIAKSQGKRIAKMLVSYDVSRQKSPFTELGGFVFTFMGDGNPGTGKTTLIQMIAGLAHDYCKVAGLPFRYENFGPDQIDSYQGKSGQNAKAFINAVLDPAAIGFGTIDDIDQVAGKRGDRQSSAGQQEVTAVLMEAFAGAGTVVRGNATFGMFSNYPENVDDALRQRAGARFLIDGPQTREDYIDILALLIGKNHRIPVGDVDLFATQAIAAAAKASYEAHNRPQEKALADVLDRVVAEIGPLDTIAKIGTYMKRIQELEPRFTGRAIKNITDAAKTRALDIEMPDEWFETPEVYLHQSLETKVEMIRELMTPITPDMLLQEINRYADSELRYAGKADDAAIASMVREMGLREKAVAQFKRGAM